MLLDFWQWYMLSSPLLLSVAIRLCARFARRPSILTASLGILLASFGMHGSFLLFQAVGEGPQYHMRPFLGVLFATMLFIVGYRCYRQLGFRKLPQYLPSNAGTDLD